MSNTTIAFKGLTLSGVVTGRTPGTTTARVQTHELFGLLGANVIDGNIEPKTWDVTVWLNGFSTLAALVAHVDQIKTKIGANGTVTLTGDIAKTIPYCTLLSLDEGMGASDAKANELPNFDGKWHQFVKLNFLQLR